MEYKYKKDSIFSRDIVTDKEVTNDNNTDSVIVDIIEDEKVSNDIQEEIIESSQHDSKSDVEYIHVKFVGIGKNTRHAISFAYNDECVGYKKDGEIYPKFLRSVINNGIAEIQNKQ